MKPDTCLTALTLIYRFTACAAAIISLSAQAAVDEDFTDATLAPGSGWTISDDARLTAATPGSAPFDTAGSGWLRLTDAVSNQRGTALLSGTGEDFTSTEAIFFEFEYVTWGSTSTGSGWGGTSRGADGISFFLYDGSSSMAGAAFGGGLGYCGGPGAYLGIGLDEWGNFAGTSAQTSNGCGSSGASDFTNASMAGSPPNNYRNHVVIRGPAVSGYPYVDAATAGFDISQSATTAVSAAYDDKINRPEPTRVKILLLPNGTPSQYRITVQTQRDSVNGGAWNTVLQDINFPYTAPTTLRLGVAASTGIENNIHEVRNVRAGSPADISITKTLHGIPVVGGTVLYTVTFTNEDIAVTPSPSYAPKLDSNTTAGLTLSDTLPASLSNISWTCTATSGNSLCPGGTTTSNGIGHLNAGQSSGFVLDGLNAQLTFIFTATLNNTACIAPNINTASADFDMSGPFYDINPGDNSAQVSFAIPVGGCTSGSVGVPYLESRMLLALIILISIPALIFSRKGMPRRN